MRITSIFTTEELELIDSGKYTPGQAMLDAKLDLAAALEREACAKVCDNLALDDAFTSDILQVTAAVIRARGEA